MIYSNYDCNNISLESKIDDIFCKKMGGVFIELGANDGLCQSNTAFLEKERNWTGILIEPSLIAFEKCKKNRPQSICINCACVSNTYDLNTAYGDFNDGILMASIDSKRLNNNNQCCVEALTLENILNNYNIKNIDFLSLDTEGYELNILMGLNLDKYRPKYMLIEIYILDYDNIINFLTEKKYTLHSNFTNYNKITNPIWDGTHNDYLFCDNDNKIC